MATLFFSYSHRDEDFRNEIETHLALLKREGFISAWHDRRIPAGGNIHGQISDQLEKADIVLLLVSAHFLASDYCFDREMTRALSREQAGDCCVVPVILKPCDWHSAPFGSLRATPTDGKPVSMFANQDEALSIIAADVRAIARRLEENSAKKSSERAASPNTALSGGKPSPQVRSSNLRLKRAFNDLEKDTFTEESFEYMARYFESSLSELADRNRKIQTNFKRLDKRSFVASIYDGGKRAATCSIWYGGGMFGKGINYSNSEDGPSNTMNESLSVQDDGFCLFWQPLGIATLAGGGGKQRLGNEGAAEYFWSILLRPLQ
jgi:hypothetical protein